MSRRIAITGMGIATHSVFRAIKGHKFHTRSTAEDINSGTKIIVNAGRICDKPYPFALKLLEPVVAEHFNAWLYLGIQRKCHGKQYY